MSAARDLLHHARGASDPRAVLGQATENHRARLRALFDIESNTPVALLPSGTDALYLLSAIALRRADRVHHVVVGASELGGGTLRAARGEWISDVAPFSSGQKGGSVTGLHSPCSAEPVYLRDRQGRRRANDEIDDEVRGLVLDAAKRGVVILHLVAHSKTGLRAPSAAACSALRNEVGDLLIVLVDAAQGRLAMRDVRRCLELGFTVLFTGSKFYSGPPFSGALVFPELLGDDPGPLPPGLADWFSQNDLPKPWTEARASLREAINPGLVLRWEAALVEIEAYHRIPPRHRAGVYHTFSSAVYEAFGPSKVVEIDVPLPPVHELVTALGAFPSVFGFAVRGADGEVLTTSQLRRLHALLDTDMRASDIALSGAYHLGQPVALGPPVEDGPAILRVALGSRLAAEHASTPDHGAAFFRETFGAVRLKVEALVMARAYE